MHQLPFFVILLKSSHLFLDFVQFYWHKWWCIYRILNFRPCNLILLVCDLVSKPGKTLFYIIIDFFYQDVDLFIRKSCFSFAFRDFYNNIWIWIFTRIRNATIYAFKYDMKCIANVLRQKMRSLFSFGIPYQLPTSISNFKLGVFSDFIQAL